MNDWMIRAGRSRLAALLAALLMALQPLAARAQLPSLGDGAEISLGAERQIGDRIARELYRDPDYIDDPVLLEYVQGIWQRLLTAARQRGELGPELDQRFAWTVLLGKDRSINAFALPGGWMGLHLGLIAASGTRDELAAVLAHELSHVTQRHIARMMAAEKRQGPWMIGAMILGALAASKSPEAAKAVMAGSSALAAQNQLNFSRDMEREADRVGFGVMTQAGFAPQGFVRMFEKLQQSARLNDDGAFPYLRTHPLTTERMAEMQSRQGAPTANAAPAPDLPHALMAARARVLSAVGVDALGALRREADTLPADAAVQRRAPAFYAAALASAKLRDLPAAQTWAERLSALSLDSPEAARTVRLLDAEIALQAGQPARAAALVKDDAQSRPGLLLLAQAELKTGHAADAAQRLQTWTALHPHDAGAWQQLAATDTAQGQTLRAIRAEAEAQAAVMDYSAAMDRLRAAQDLARRSGADHIEASIIDSRAREIESRLREQALER